MKSSIKFLLVFCIAIMCFSNVFAGEMLDFTVDSDICRFSDYIANENTLPYIRVSEGRIEVDTDVNKSGMAISAANINVEKDMSRFQVLTAQDKITINGSLENAILLAPTVVIDGKVSETVLVFSQSLSLTENSVVDGEILAVAIDLQAAGKINGNVIALAESVNVPETANIKGGLRVSTSAANISEMAKITGKIYCKSEYEITVPDSLKDNIQMVKLQIEEEETTKSLPLVSIAISSLAFAAIYMLINAKTKLLANISERVKNKIGFILLLGLLAIFVIPVLAIVLLTISLFGLHSVALPIFVLVMALIILAIMLRIFIVGIIIVQGMLSTKYASAFDTNLKKFILALITFLSIALMEYIPFIGGYLTYLYVIVTLGLSLILSIFSKIGEKTKN